MMNEDIMWDYSTIDGLSIYGDDLELNMQRRDEDEQKEEGVNEYEKRMEDFNETSAFEEDKVEKEEVKKSRIESDFYFDPFIFREKNKFWDSRNFRYCENDELESYKHWRFGSLNGEYQDNYSGQNKWGYTNEFKKNTCFMHESKFREERSFSNYEFNSNRNDDLKPNHDTFDISIKNFESNGISLERCSNSSSIKTLNMNSKVSVNKFGEKIKVNSWK